MVARVDFYVLAATNTQARWDFTCRLAEKAYKLGNSVLILLANASDAQALDARLWACQPESFIPHKICDPSQAPTPAIDGVCLCTAPPHQPAFDLIINLAAEPLKNLGQFGRLAEVVIQVEAVLQSTRQLFSYYKSLELPIQTHKL